MVEPRVQYAKTEDGVSIAYWTMGEGAPLVHAPYFPLSHIQMEWQWPAYRKWYERLARGKKLVGYDHRGSGLSERRVADYSLEAMMFDLKAVIDRLELGTFSLFAGYHLGPVGIEYAARHPEQVSRLILWCTWARASDYYASPQVQTVGGLRDKDWEIYTETVSHTLLGWAAGDPAHRFAAHLRESLTQEAMGAFVAATSQFDVSALLRDLKPPTLIVQRRRQQLAGMELARSLASGIPNARLSVMEGEEIVPFLGNMEAVASAIDEFLSEGEEEAAGTPASGGFATILFTDMESSTTLAQQLGDAGAQEVRHAHNDIVRSAMGAHDGREIKHTGDGIMASFATASSALECAIAIQRGVAAHKQEQPDSPLGVYVGISAGEPIAEDDPDGRVDLFGTSIDLARRICDHAEPGQILAADVVRQLAAGKQFLFADLGETELRGFEDPVKLWELRWEEN